MTDFIKTFLAATGFALLAAMIAVPSAFEPLFAAQNGTAVPSFVTSLVMLALPMLTLLTLFAASSED